MRERHSTTVNGGIGFAGLLTIAFIVLKLLGIITWSWIWVFSPIWIEIILIVLLLAVLIILGRRW